MGLFKDLWAFLSYRKEFCLLPLIFGTSFVRAGGSTLAAFTHTLFYSHSLCWNQHKTNGGVAETEDKRSRCKLD